MAVMSQNKEKTLLPVKQAVLVRFFIVALFAIAFLLPGCRPFSDFFDYQIRSEEGNYDSTTVSEPYESHSDSEGRLPFDTSNPQNDPSVNSDESALTDPSSEIPESSSTEETTTSNPTGATTSSAITTTIVATDPTATPTATSTPKPTASPTPSPKPTAKPTATATPKPTASPTPSPTPTPVVVPTTGTYQPALSDQVITLVNEERAAEGLPALSKNSHLTSSADIRSPEIVVVWSHTRPDGSSCSTAVSGLSWTRFGENIAKGYVTAEAAMTGWMNSEGHRANIMDPDYTMIGVSCYLYDGKYYWVQHFAA